MTRAFGSGIFVPGERSAGLQLQDLLIKFFLVLYKVAGFKAWCSAKVIQQAILSGAVLKKSPEFVSRERPADFSVVRSNHWDRGAVSIYQFV